MRKSVGSQDDNLIPQSAIWIRWTYTGGDLERAGLAEQWRARVAEGDERIFVEVEMWYRRDDGIHKATERKIAEAVSELDGRVVTSANIKEIAYHAIIVDLPIDAVGMLIEHKQVRLVQTDSVMFLRPLGQVAAPIGDEDESPVHQRKPFAVSPGLDLGPRDFPTVALFDGLPIANHRRLAGLISIDDPDEWAANYPASDRHHGTAMASLILHGELDAAGPTLSRPLYVRPILLS